MRATDGRIKLPIIHELAGSSRSVEGIGARYALPYHIDQYSFGLIENPVIAFSGPEG